MAIDFDEYPFPAPTQVLQGPAGTMSVTYNLFDDATGAELASDNGDLPDVTLIYTTSPPGALATSGRPSIEINPTATNQLTGRSGYTDPPGANNPGTRQWYSIEVRFAGHLDITAVTIDTNSLNTAGIGWEFTVVSFLDEGFAPFSTPPIVDSYLVFAPGTTGPVGTGHFLAAETGTVTGVGTNLTAAGTNGGHDQVDDEISTSDVVLPGTAVIGGFVLTTTLEDVRGVTNGTTAFSSSIRDITIEGTITQVVPDADVAISKVGEVVDDQAIYQVTVTNSGSDDATGVEVTDVLPSEVSYVSDDCGASNQPPWTWPVGSLANGESATCTIVTDVLDPSVFQNQATVTGSEDDPEPDNNVAAVVLDATGQASTTTTIGSTTTTSVAATTTTDPEVTDVTLPFTGARGGGVAGGIALGALTIGVLLVVESRRTGPI
ncbi:MAG: DUF11 domain-containing protein [Actinobacteria bacterium]|nr:DUF11 domain-containing protein [Actinomycetota bacterium]